MSVGMSKNLATAYLSLFFIGLSLSAPLLAENFPIFQNPKTYFGNPGAGLETGTTEPHNSVNLDDVFISVKTTQNNHASRIKLVLDTWYNLAKDQTYFFTDSHDQAIEDVTGSDHWIVTGCSPAHTRQALCCKLGSEFDNFMNTNKRWFCHFDDDNYVNVPVLVSKLREFDPRKDWYLGKPSTRLPIEIHDRNHLPLHFFCHFDDDNYVNVPVLVSKLREFDPRKDWYLGKPSTRLPIEIHDRNHLPERISFWFATGGAGFCLSRPLAEKVAPMAKDGRFMTLGERIRLPDDVTMGYLIEHLLGRKMTVVDEFHSHLEMLKNIPQESLEKQISLSYGGYDPGNAVSVPEHFPLAEDPTRIRSLHCHLFPSKGLISGCNRDLKER